MRVAKNEAREKVPEIVLQKYGVIGAIVEPIAKETVNKVYVVVHGEAKYILKMCNIKREEAIASVHVQKRMYDAGGPVAQVMLSLQGDEYVEQDGKIWFLQEYLTGREFDPEKETDPEEIATFVIRIHTLLDDLWEQGIGKEVFLKRLEENFQSREESIERLSTINARGLDCAERLVDERRKGLQGEPVRNRKRFLRIVHNDIRPRNIIITKDREWKLIDFDYVRIGDLCYELGSSALFLSGFDLERAKKIIRKCRREYIPELDEDRVVENLYAYYLESNYPFSRDDASDYLIRVTCEERLAAIEFCKQYRGTLC